MAKVTITIDDTNPTLVAAFGENALEAIADGEMGYQSMVEVLESELPAKIEVELIDKVTGEPYTKMDYPEGTELYKPNPQSKADFVAFKILTENIAPRLVQGLAVRKRAEAALKADKEIKQAEQIVVSVAEVTTE